MRRWLRKHLPDRRQVLLKNSHFEKVNQYLSNHKFLILNRHSVACGVAVGLFAAFIPLPIQTLIAVILAILLRGNILIAALMTWVSNPATFAFIVYIIYATGDWVLGQKDVNMPIDTFSSSTFEWMSHFSKAYLIGLPIIALSVALFGYLIVIAVWDGFGFFYRLSHIKQISNNKKYLNFSWHSYDINEIFKTLETQITGLTDVQVKKRLKIYGYNILKPAKTRGFFLRFIDQFNHLLVFVLLGSAFLSAIFQHWVDMSVILGVVFLDAMIGIFQERKAEKALSKIKHMLALQALVIRENQHRKIPAKNLLPGDLVLLKMGDKVPADLRLIEARNLQIQEAMLTGESLPIEKSTASVSPDTDLGSRTSMAYSGTYVTYGKGLGVVIAIGDDTEVGKIGSILSEVSTATTPLLKQINLFSRWLTIIILSVASITFIFGVFVRGYAIKDMFMAAVSLAVAAIPEGLPAIITITLAIGVTRMAKRNVIIRSLPAVETLGSVNVICTDKTGTLTPNELTVEKVVTAKDDFLVTGVGYGMLGDIKLYDQVIAVENYMDLKLALQAAVLCNDAALTHHQDEVQLYGSPLDGALLNLGLKAKIDLKQQKQNYPIKDILPFDSERKWMGTLHHDVFGHNVIFIKGAPEIVLRMCSYQRENGKNVRLIPNYWFKQIENLANSGQRVIAIAIDTKPGKHNELKFYNLENRFTMLALFGFLDAPNEETIAAVSECQSAGIVIKMVTGDYVATAKSVARQLGIRKYENILTGHDLDKLNFDDLIKRVDEIAIFARTSPLHKLDLVRALQANGQIVAMTGDGVNDAPALKQANIGIAMGKKGTEVAKEAAEIILTDDNFTSIVTAVREGRTVYDNLRKTILFVLPTDGGEALVIVVGILFGWTLPITPLQILWINMVTAVTLGLALAFEPTEIDVMQRPPNKIGRPIFSSFLIWQTLFVTILMLLGTFGLFLYAIEVQKMNLDVARTMMVNAIVAGEIAYLFNTRKIYASTFNFTSLHENKILLIAVFTVIVLQFLFSYAPFMQYLFGTSRLSLIEWSYIFLFGISLFLLVEFEKFLARRFKSLNKPKDSL